MGKAKRNRLLRGEHEIPTIGEREPVKLAVLMPTHDMVPSTFMYCMNSMTAFTVASMPEDMIYGLTMKSGTYVHTARQELLEAALEEGVTHMLWVDTDMRFPRDALVKLFLRNKPIVGINYANRGVPADFVAIKHYDFDLEGNGERLITNDDSTGLEEVDALGFGMVLMQSKVFENLPSLDDKPWFFFEWLKGRRQVGEDVWFCRMLREEMGQKIYVDHDLSKECAHIGQFEYECGHANLSYTDERLSDGDNADN